MRKREIGRSAIQPRKLEGMKAVYLQNITPVKIVPSLKNWGGASFYIFTTTHTAPICYPDKEHSSIFGRWALPQQENIFQPQQWKWERPSSRFAYFGLPPRSSSLHETPNVFVASMASKFQECTPTKVSNLFPTGLRISPHFCAATNTNEEKGFGKNCGAGKNSSESVLNTHLKLVLVGTRVCL